MNFADELTICGDALAINEVNLDVGFQIIPVLTNVNSPIPQIFSNPENDILYIYDMKTGGVYWPGGGINSLTILKPGIGYMAYLINPVTINFPDYDNYFFDNKATAENSPVSPWPCNPNINIHFISVDKEAVSDFETGFIGAFDIEGRCIGFATIDETDQNYLLAVYGDDEYTAQKDGATSGEIISFKARERFSNLDIKLTPVYDRLMPQHDGTFMPNGLSKIARFYKESTGFNEKVTPEMIQVFPQPASDLITIIYPFTGENVNLQLLSMEGKILKTGFITSTQTELNIGNIPAGVYVLKIHERENLILKKVVIQ
jgi:hypothetical protein